MGDREVGRGAAERAVRRYFCRAGLIAAVLLLVLTLAPSAALAFSLPGRRSPAAPPASPAMGRSSQQEVAPPLAVQQLQEALEARRPRVEIVSPADGALVPAGPWTLQLRVEDWPLVDAGPLGLGPHLVVQLDGDAPLPLTATTTTMRPLEPGSHRLTVYAARPWGEAVKSPGAQRQIRLHRVAANPLGLPAPGSPQLIAVSPRGTAAGTPLLLDWLLLEVPLQNLRSGDASWRLRVGINGDSFLVDRQAPLWLEGWRPGSNAVQLDLLDGLGEPLNPPFNSLVGEVILEPGGEAPRWQQGRLTPSELAILLGEAPPPPAAEPEQAAEADAPPVPEATVMAEPPPPQETEQPQMAEPQVVEPEPEPQLVGPAGAADAADPESDPDIPDRTEEPAPQGSPVAAGDAADGIPADGSADAAAQDPAGSQGQVPLDGGVAP
ncbi:hypothetical protein L107_15737 [Cyanobium sp. Copco_Reservoir_LC18]|uniref:hypothetical protein n=1 Tax=Cyanobium sp. Copco_Reservoir_LC18 TaxID=1328305 RepID=UPI0016938872|nr:hypothetical protein [Cyanobium sp. Copco_Reservoir_LC18]KAF0652353.1 hypothetical protein L107_15737 [Cyanobium sp. Copco_Reservoir_LC18]